MLTHTELKKGVKIVLDKEPYEVLEANPMKKAQRRPVIQSRIKNLITSNVFERNFHQGETFEEAEIEKIKAKFLYGHRDKFFFCQEDNSSFRFDLPKQTIGDGYTFLKPNEIVEAMRFEGKIINVLLPIKVKLKVVEAPPGIKGDRAQGGTKLVALESGAKINVPLFIKEGDVIEINIENKEYVRRVEEHL